MLLRFLRYSCFTVEKFQIPSEVMCLMPGISFLVKYNGQHDSATCIKTLQHIYTLWHFGGRRGAQDGEVHTGPSPLICFSPSCVESKNVSPFSFPWNNASPWSWNSILPGCSFLGASLGLLGEKMLMCLFINAPFKKLSVCCCLFPHRFLPAQDLGEVWLAFLKWGDHQGQGCV